MHQIPCRAAMNSVEWNPKYNLLAYAGDDKNKYQADEGNCSCFSLYQADAFRSFLLTLFIFCFLSQGFLEYLALKAPNNLGRELTERVV